MSKRSTHMIENGHHILRESWLAGGQPPFSVQVEVSSRCNLACRMCPLTSENSLSSLSPGHIDDKTWQGVAEMIQVAGMARISGFGEPLLHPRLFDYLEELNALGIIMALTTNGIALNEKNSARLAVLENLLHINVSIDSPDPEVYRQIRGGDLQKALKGLSNLLGELADHGGVTVSSVMMQESIATLSDFPPLLARMGVKTYVLQGLVDYTAETRDSQLTGRSDLQSHIQRLEESCRRSGMELVFTQHDRLDLELSDPGEAIRKYHQGSQDGAEHTRQCLLPWEMPYVDKDGRVFACCYAAQNPDEVLGHVADGPLEEIWKDTAYRRIREALLTGESLPGTCQGCMAVPRGIHPLREVSAEIVPERSRLKGTPPLEVIFRNTGSLTWKKADPISVGTAMLREHESPLADPSWISRRRIGGFAEAEVPPEGLATFALPARPGIATDRDSFQLVWDGKCWIPGTAFQIQVDGRPPIWARLRAMAAGLLTSGRRRQRFSPRQEISHD